MDMKKLGKKALVVFLINAIICCVLLTLFAILIIRLATSEEQFLAGVLACVIVGGAIGIVSIVFAILKYKFYRYGYDDMRVTIHFGVIFKHRVTIPVRQIQDLHLYEGPIMLIFGLSSVIFSTAGSNFVLKLISKEAGKQIIHDLEDNLNKRLEVTEDEKIL